MKDAHAKPASLRSGTTPWTIAPAVLAVAFFGMLYCGKAEPPGKKVYLSKGCNGCHNFGGGDSATGPDLKGVTKRRTDEWLRKWIKDPTGMLKTDKTAKELAKKFPNPMPNLPVTDSELGQIIAYLKWEDGNKTKMTAFKPLNKAEFEEGKKIFFNRCSGCHGAARWGATGPSLLPDHHIKQAKKIPGGGTKAKGTESLIAMLQNGSPKGMPAWGREGILSSREVKLMARYVQMEPPTIPELSLATAKKAWKVIVPVKDRPKSDATNGNFLNYFGVVMRDAGEVAIIDGRTYKRIVQVKVGFATHILRSSHSGRYFFAIGRDGRVTLIDLWYKTPKVVARGRTCWDARSIDGSKAPGYVDKYAVVGCYTPSQYMIIDGQTLEPLSVKSVADSRDWKTGRKLPEVRVAAIVASENKPFWILNLKESGWVYMVDYRNPRKPRETRIRANNALHDGGWVILPGSKERRYFIVAANAKNQLCVIDTVAKRLVRAPVGAGPCITVGQVPHPGRGANFVHPKYGPVFATSHISDDKVVFVGVDPKGHPKHAWRVVETHKLKTAGSLFVKTHPKSRNLWIDMPLSADKGANGQIAVYNIDTGKIRYLDVSGKRIVHMEYNREGTELWISGWLADEIYVYDDKTLKLKKTFSGSWVKTPTGKFNVYNTMHDVY